VVRMTEAEHRRRRREAAAHRVEAEAANREWRQRLEDEAQRERDELDDRITRYVTDHRTPA
jgi:hypothetical protein